MELDISHSIGQGVIVHKRTKDTVIPNNARPLRITAAAGTKLAGASSLVTVIIFTSESALQP